jgi:predicted Zn finger-like uncharacterized protein
MCAAIAKQHPPQQDAPRRGFLMKIVCPTCEATYEVPEAVLAAKRQVRCARCNNDWVPGDTWQPDAPHGQAAAPANSPSAPAPAPAAAPAAAPAPAPAEPPAAAAGIAPPVQADPPPPLAAAEPPEAIEPPQPPPAPEPEPVTEAPPPAPARLRQSAATAFGNPPPAPPTKPATRTPVGAWIASVVALSIFVGAGVALRAPIMKAWPPSERLYAALGMHIPH